MFQMQLSEEIVNDAEAKEWTQCIELLKAMLRVDANERITPSEVLNHLFITQSYINETLQPAASEPGTSQARTDLMRTETATEADDRHSSYLLILLLLDIFMIQRPQRLFYQSLSFLNLDKSGEGT